MNQKLILPIHKARLTASIDTEAYSARFGFRHYGSDIVSISGYRTVYASGEGRVAAVGWDNACGNVLAVVYPGAYNHRGRWTEDVTIRYLHLDKVEVQLNQQVNKDTRLGYYGATGKYAGTGPHLHMEADTDTRMVLYTPTVTSSNYLRGVSQGAYPFASPQNTVFNVMEVLHCKTTVADLQTYTTAGDAFIREEDKRIPYIR